MASDEVLLVTGGCGFIGTNLVMTLVAHGARVRVLDNLVGGKWSPVLTSSVEFINGDVRDFEAVKRAVAGVSKVIHLAAIGSVVDSVMDPLRSFEVNVAGTLTVLRACVAAQVNRLVFASTGGAAIGEHIGPVHEEAVPKPVSPYGASKVAGEAYCHAFAKSSGLHTIALRFANVYGPYSEHKRSAVVNFIRAVEEDKPIEVYGDGSATRDFLYVTDLCNGILLALEQDVAPGSLFHLASGIETSVNELIQVILRIAGKRDYPVIRSGSRVGEVQKNVASFELAKVKLGFEPVIALEEGISSTSRWFRNVRAGNVSA